MRYAGVASFQPSLDPQSHLTSFAVNEAQSFASWARSISSAVQKEASAFLYISQISSCWMGKMTNLPGFSWRSGSGVEKPAISCFLWSLTFPFTAKALTLPGEKDRLGREVSSRPGIGVFRQRERRESARHGFESIEKEQRGSKRQATQCPIKYFCILR